MGVDGSMALHPGPWETRVSQLHPAPGSDPGLLTGFRLHRKQEQGRWTLLSAPKIEDKPPWLFS